MEIINQIEFTSDTWCIALPIILCIIDVATGYINAWSENEISSKIMREGLGKKFGEIVFCVLGWLAFLSFGVKLFPIFTALYISIMEITSIFENLDKLGVPIPVFVKNRINNIKDDMEGKDDVQ